jgi:hypothetical protein
MLYLKNYISFFSPDFLFSFGDHDGRHQVVGMGLLYKWQLPFLLVGLYWFLKQKNNLLKYTILGILLAAPLVPAVAVPSPHTLRSLLMVIPLNIITAAGIYTVFSSIKNRKRWILIGVLLFVFCIESTLYLHKYYTHYPVVNALDWGAGYKHIVVDKTLHFAPVYFHFYAPDMKVTYVDVDWRKPKDWENKKVLYIRPFYGNRNEKQSIDQVYLPGPNMDIFTQFWKI